MILKIVLTVGKKIGIYYVPTRSLFVLFGTPSKRSSMYIENDIKTRVRISA